MNCNKQSYCDGFPEQCPGCQNITQASGTYTVNNINIQVSGGHLLSALCLMVGCILMVSMMSNGSREVHNIAGAILPDRDSVYYLTQVG